MSEKYHSNQRGESELANLSPSSINEKKVVFPFRLTLERRRILKTEDVPLPLFCSGFFSYARLCY